MGRSPTNTREKLIETAIDLIWQSSYGSVSVDEICKVADVKKGSFYHYFPSKVDLAVAAMDQHFKDKIPALDAALSPSIPPLQRLENLADLVCEKQREAKEKYGHICGCAFAALGSEMAGLEEAIRAKTDEIFACHRKYVQTTLRDLIAEGLLAADTDVAAKADEIETLILGSMMMARIQNSMTPLTRDLKSGIFRIIGVAEKTTAAE